MTLTNALMLHDNDHTPYEGMEVTGWPEVTLVRGVPVVEGGALVGAEGHGQFLPHGVFPTPFNPVDRRLA